MSIRDLINEVNFNTGLLNQTREYRSTYSAMNYPVQYNKRAPLRVRLSHYKHPFPTCVSYKDFCEWLAFTNSLHAVKLSFCSDCPIEHKIKKVIEGTCNCKNWRRLQCNKVKEKN